MRTPPLLLPILAFLTLTGCNEGGKTPPILDTPVCEINSLNEGWDKCKEGQVMAFLPPSFGNEQFPIIAIALYCDFHHPIAHTTGGVSCIFTSARKPPAQQDDQKQK